MAYRKVSDESLQSVADAIRAKAGTSGTMAFPTGFVSAVEGIQTGSTEAEEMLTEIIERTATSVVIPEGITKIGLHAFDHCEQLKSVEMPDSVKSIGGYAFQTCGVLASIKMSANLESIGDNAFFKCCVLTSVELPASVTEINTTAFSRCDALTDIYVPWAEGAVEGAPWGATKATIHYEWTGEEAEDAEA